jgi:GNAT superfamily N-acetyltransferase
MESKNKYHLKKISSADFAEVAQLVNSAYRGDSSREGWTTEADFLDGQRTDALTLKKELEDENKIVLCLRSEPSPEIIGTVFLEKFKDAKGVGCYLGMLTVKPTIQNGGLGRWMLAEAETYAKSIGALRMTLGVLHLRHELMAWYERRGYKKTGELQDFPYGQDEFGLPKTKGLHFIMFEKTI